MKLFLIAALFLVYSSAYSQCVVTTTTKGTNMVVISTEDYQYVRTSTKYYSISVQTILTKTKGDDSYTLNIKYTGDALGIKLMDIVFIGSMGEKLSKKVRFIKVLKNDNPKAKTKLYTASITGTDIDHLKQTDLNAIEMVFTNNAKPISITVNDPAFLKNQIACVAGITEK